MKVFISWSGERSQYIAAALRDWLPNVIQSLDPWMSDKDIDGGSRWLLALAGQLNEAMTGILCVTPENQSNPWLVFEAGALSKTIGQTMVCPLLYDLEPTQMTGPLSQFQAKALDRTSVLSILNTLNASITAGKLTSQRLELAFDRCWPELDAKLKNVPTNDAAHKPKRKSDDMLEEILSIVRDTQRRGFEQNIPVSRTASLDQTIVKFLKTSLGPKVAVEPGLIGVVKAIRELGPDVEVDEILRRDFGGNVENKTAALRDLLDRKRLGNEGKFDE